MGFFSRLGTLLRSNINELINKAEDPEKMLNQVLVDIGDLVGFPIDPDPPADLPPPRMQLGLF